jgi:site-specific DNA-methyltransferase (adenine-specific)
MARAPSKAEEETRCPSCLGQLSQPARGRRRCYCSRACRQLAYRERNDHERRRRLVKLVRADARVWLPTLPPESVDLVLTDPPYCFTRGGTYFRDWFSELGDSEWEPIFCELSRLLRPNTHAYVFCDDRARPLFDQAAEAAGFRRHPPLIWDKDWLGLGQAAWRSRYEYICWYEKGSRPGNHNNRANVIRARRVHRGYPTEKPVTVLEALIEQASLPGELVLDPFCGSGNTGRAARSLGRRALLADIAPEVAASRLRNAIAPWDGTIALRNGRARGRLS